MQKHSIVMIGDTHADSCMILVSFQKVFKNDYREGLLLITQLPGHRNCKKEIICLQPIVLPATIPDCLMVEVRPMNQEAVLFGAVCVSVLILMMHLLRK